MKDRPHKDGARPARTPEPEPVAATQLARAEAMYREGETRSLAQELAGCESWTVDKESMVRLMLLRGMALFDIGDVVDAVEGLRRAVELSENCSTGLSFSAAFALFVRETDFQSPDELLPALSRLRQRALQIGDAKSLAGLHLALARLEGHRGHCIDAHRHLEIARRLTEVGGETTLLCSLDLVEGSLESVAGNLTRSRLLAQSCLARAEKAGYAKYKVGATANLAILALFAGRLQYARQLFDEVLRSAGELTYVRLGTLDSIAQADIQEKKPAAAEETLARCQEIVAREDLPARSWYDLAHQLTRCTYFEERHDWEAILDVVDEADPELARRQFKALRTSLLCAKARAQARLGQHAEAKTALATAIRSCPRGAVDPLIALEASQALCSSLSGDTGGGAVHFDRALAACRAIGHRYHEWWIDRDRASLETSRRSAVAGARPRPTVADTALLLGDVAAVLGAGHSIDLLAHRMANILQGTTMGSRVEVESESGLPYDAQPSATWESTADGSFRIRLRGSDRQVHIRVNGVQSIDEISLLKSVADVVQAAVQRTADTEAEDEEQTLWPRTLVQTDDDAVFRSPRMVELLRIAVRLASTPLPVLITGETGTGKEIIARLVHEHSRVSQGPFVPFNCSSVPRDLVESQLFGHRRGAFTGATEASTGVIRSAEGGTLFLDEIGDLDLSAQPKLLRFLESGEIHPVGDVTPRHVNVRVVAATNAELEDRVAAGQFRADLFYRIDAARIALPPLRERKDEIPALASFFLSRYARECERQGVRLGDDLIAALLLYDWPGNIRQLANEIRRVVAVAADGQTLSSTDLAPEITRNWQLRRAAPDEPARAGVHVALDQTLATAIDELEQKFIEHALGATGGRVTDAARLLGLSRKGLFLKRQRRGMIKR